MHDFCTTLEHVQHYAIIAKYMWFNSYIAYELEAMATQWFGYGHILQYEIATSLSTHLGVRSEIAYLGSMVLE